MWVSHGTVTIRHYDLGVANREPKMTLRNICTTLAAVMLAALASVAAALDITGAGATFPYPVYAKWAEAYKAKTGVGMNYQSIGSGGGIKQIQNKTVDFGASDMPLKPEELDKDGLLQFPTVIGGDVPVVNLEGVKPGELKLSTSARSPSGTTRRLSSSTRTPSCLTRKSRSCTAPTARGRPLSGSITSRR